MKIVTCSFYGEIFFSYVMKIKYPIKLSILMVTVENN